MNTRQRWLVAVVGSLLLAAQSFAADDPLSLEEAVNRAAREAPDVLARRAAVESAQELITPAGRLPDPEAVIGIDNLPITGPDAGSLTRDFMTMQKIGVMQAFPRRAKRELRTQLANDSAALAQAEAIRTTLDVKRQTALAWISASIAETTLAQLRALESEFRLQLELANAQLKSGRITAAEALAAQAELLAFHDRMQAAEQAVRLARLELARWLPEDGARPLANAPGFTELPKNQLLSNLHDHASLVAYNAQLDAARSEIALAQAEKRPDWSVGLMYQKRGDAFSDMVSVEVRVGLPVFAGNRQNPMIAAKRAELRKVEAEREAELRMHGAEVKIMLDEWETLKSRIAVFETERLPLAAQRMRLATTSIESGRGDVKSALSANLNYVELQLQLLDLKAELGRTWVALNYLQNDRSEP